MYARQLVQRENHLRPIQKVLKSDRNPFDITPLHRDLSAAMSSNSETLSYLKSYDITKLVSPNVLNETFPCHFISGNLAWMSEQDGHYRYFTRNYKGYVFSLDLIDFLSLYYDSENLPSIIKRLSSKAGVIHLDERWRKGQEIKYRNNIEKFDETAFPIEYRRLLEPLKVIYEALNREGIRHLGPMNLSVGHEAMFFASQRYLGEKIGVSSSQVGRAILLMQYLGLIEVVSDSQIPGSYLEKSIKYAKNRKRINYYIIPNYIEKIEIMRIKCDLAIKSDITISNISRNTIVEINNQ